MSDGKWKADLNPGSNNIFPVTGSSVSQTLPKGEGWYMFSAIGVNVNVSTETTVSWPAAADVGMVIQSGTWTPALYIESPTIKIIGSAAQGYLVALPVKPLK